MTTGPQPTDRPARHWILGLERAEENCLYGSADHWTMMADQGRGTAYAEALRRVVKPGSVVVDIGTGTGVFALQAARLGAARVYAIEYDDSIQVARALAAATA